jgi:mitogen-activated protein kinase kinase
LSIKPKNIIMSDGFGARTLKRKNVKGLALNAPAPRPVAPLESDQQAPAGLDGDINNGRTAQLEIGIEYKLDLKREDLEVLKELGSGNGGTVSKVRHIATGTIMARKVIISNSNNFAAVLTILLKGHPRGS